MERLRLPLGPKVSGNEVRQVDKMGANADQMRSSNTLQAVFGARSATPGSGRNRVLERRWGRVPVWLAPLWSLFTLGLSVLALRFRPIFLSGGALLCLDPCGVSAFSPNAIFPNIKATPQPAQSSLPATLKSPFGHLLTQLGLGSYPPAPAWPKAPLKLPLSQTAKKFPFL